MARKHQPGGDRHRPAARPKRAGSAPKNNPPRGTAGQNKPSTGASVGGTGRGSRHGRGSAGTGGKGCAKSVVPIVLMTLFYALPRLAWDTWRERRR